MAYGGPTLKPEQLIYWAVTTWDNHNVSTTSSERATFETALGSDGWSGTEWLARFAPKPLDPSSCDLFQASDRNASPRFRGIAAAAAAAGKTVARVRAYVVGLGCVRPL